MNTDREGVSKLYMGVADCIFWSRYVHAVKHHGMEGTFIYSAFSRVAHGR